MKLKIILGFVILIVLSLNLIETLTDKNDPKELKSKRACYVDSSGRSICENTFRCGEYGCVGKRR